LPDSDLLKLIHSYSSDFYGKQGLEESFASMDGSALLAMGILLEEAARLELGKTGDLALLDEGEILYRTTSDGNTVAAGDSDTYITDPELPDPAESLPEDQGLDSALRASAHEPTSAGLSKITRPGIKKPRSDKGKGRQSASSLSSSSRLNKKRKLDG
jgi:hypothetical protein